MEKLKEIFGEALTFTSERKLWGARHSLCTLYDPRNPELCKALDRAIQWIDIRMANLSNEVKKCGQ